MDPLKDREPSCHTPWEPVVCVGVRSKPEPLPHVRLVVEEVQLELPSCRQVPQEVQELRCCPDSPPLYKSREASNSKGNVEASCCCSVPRVTKHLSLILLWLLLRQILQKWWTLGLPR